MPVTHNRVNFGYVSYTNMKGEKTVKLSPNENEGGFKEGAYYITSDYSNPFMFLSGTVTSRQCQSEGDACDLRSGTRKLTKDIMALLKDGEDIPKNLRVAIIQMVNELIYFGRSKLPVKPNATLRDNAISTDGADACKFELDGNFLKVTLPPSGTFESPWL